MISDLNGSLWSRQFLNIANKRTCFASCACAFKSSGLMTRLTKSIILKNFKLLQNDPDTDRIFSQPPLISFKRDKNIGNFLVRSALQTSNQAGTFKCTRARCKTCPFICNVEKLSGPKRSIKITDHFTCTSANAIYCIIRTLCKELYIGETGRRLGDRFREHAPS